MDKRRLWIFTAIVGILGVAAVLRFWQINTIPPGFHFDEAFEGLEAWRILTEPGYRPVFLSGNFGVPPLNAYANALTFAVFQLAGGDAGPTAMRVTAAIFGLLGVLAVYLLGDEMRRYDWRLTRAFPLLAAGVLAVMRWHVHFSRMGIEPVIVPLEWAAASWLLLRGWRTGSLWSFAGCGAMLAASMYTYQGAWVIPILVAVTAGLLGWSWRRERKETRETGRASAPETTQHALRPTFHASRFTPHLSRSTGLILAAAVAVLLVLPLALFFLRNPDLLLLRAGQIALGSEAAAQGTFVQNLWATIKMFVPVQGTGDLDPRRNLPGAPVLSLWLAVPFWIGLGMALWRMRGPIYAMLVVGLAGLLLPGVVSEYAPHFHRVLGAAAPVALLIALPLDWVWGRGKEGNAGKEEGGEVRLFPKSRTSGQETQLRGKKGLVAAGAILALVFGLALFATVRDYFVRWAALPDLYYAFDEGLWQVGQWVAAQPEDAPLYLTPRDAHHATLAFAWRERTELPVAFDGRSIFPLSAAVLDSAEQYVAIEHEDFRTRLLLPGVFPDAMVTKQFYDRSGQVYAQVYTRPAGEEPQLLPGVTVDETLGDGIRLLGYDIIPPSPRPGEIMYLRLQWLVDLPPAGDWTIFTHLVDPDDPSRAVLAGSDSRPGRGSLPTNRWQAGWRVIDEYQVSLPGDLLQGDYRLEIGLYKPSGERLPDGPDGLMLGGVTITEAQ